MSQLMRTDKALFMLGKILIYIDNIVPLEILIKAANADQWSINNDDIQSADDCKGISALVLSH